MSDTELEEVLRSYHKMLKQPLKVALVNEGEGLPPVAVISPSVKLPEVAISGDALMDIATDMSGAQGAYVDDESDYGVSEDEASETEAPTMSRWEMKKKGLIQDEPVYIPQAAPEAPRPPPASNVALMFPGQGSQYVKMLEEVKDMPKVQELIEITNRVMEMDILKICLEGPEEILEETSVCQPAMYLGGMAALYKLQEENPAAVESPGCVAGLSLGEYTALCATGVFTFEEGMQLVKLRGQAMSDAAKASEQGMCSVAGLDQGTLENLCAKAAKEANGVCQIANVLFPKGFSCSGTKAAIDALEQPAKDAGALQVKQLKTSGAFHTPLMKPAQERLQAALDELLPRMQPPKCDVYMNVTGKAVRAGTPPSDFIPLLAQQLVSPVLWEPSVTLMIKEGMTEFYECGPQKQLKAMMKRIDQSNWKNTYNIIV